MADSIGQLLRTARDDSNLSAAELARVTRIPAASLQALEESRFEDLPAPVFVRGFIRGYCREVDIDPEEILSQYDTYLHEREIIDNEPGTVMGPVLMPRAELPDPSDRGLEISHILLVLLAIVTFIIAYLTAGVPSKNAVDPTQSAQTQQSSFDKR